MHVQAGLKAALMLADLGPEIGGRALPEERLHDAVHVILSYQNHDGGWATYENTRSFHALEVNGEMHLHSLRNPDCPSLFCQTHALEVRRVAKRKHQTDYGSRRHFDAAYIARAVLFTLASC